jgi:hypothetical protein
MSPSANDVCSAAEDLPSYLDISDFELVSSSESDDVKLPSKASSPTKSVASERVACSKAGQENETQSSNLSPIGHPSTVAPRIQKKKKTQLSQQKGKSN